MEVDFLRKEIKPGDTAVRIKNAGYSSYFELVTVIAVEADKVKILPAHKKRTSWIQTHKLIIYDNSN